MAGNVDLIAFFLDTQEDDRGRKFSDILKWSDSELEYTHDYIQILFPLPEASKIIGTATVIDKRVFQMFRLRPELQERLRAAFIRMLSFYGLKWLEDEGEKSIVRGDNFHIASQNWVGRFDHNHLRITRIIRSLRILGLEEEALVFFEALKMIQKNSQISPKSLTFWSRAASRPLNIAPHVEPRNEDALQGPKFLRDFEKMRQEKSAITKAEEADIVMQLSDTP